MKTSPPRYLPLLALLLIVSGCDFVGDVIEFGFWTGVIVVALVVGVLWLLARAFRRPRP